MAGTCCAITAARAGVRVVLVQDRPVLGGNASSEVRLWILGATSHMANNNRWAREGGVIDEILVENTFRNPEGNPVLVDTILLEKVAAEKNITLLLNTSVFEVEKAGDAIRSVRGFCSQNQTMYALYAPLFVDASGDGAVGFLAGAAFRMGAEAKGEFGEGWAPEKEERDLLGHSLYFYTEDAGRPVRFTPPAYALSVDDVENIARYRRFDAGSEGCSLWWIEYGGRLDTVHETEAIKWELWRVVYGIWNYVKNSGRFPEAETKTLAWVGTIPGKRESRRFEGEYMLRQQDVVEQRRHADAVAVGGWALDLHPPEGVYSDRPGAVQYHARGVYGIPYRCFYSRNVDNLFLAGRIISATHVAFGSTRVMATCAHSAQAVGMAAARCLAEEKRPRDLTAPEAMWRLQRDLLRSGQYIPGFTLNDPDDLAQQATITATSRLRLAGLPPDGPWRRLDDAWAMLLPLPAGPVPRFRFIARAGGPAALRLELRASERLGSFTPDACLAEQEVQLEVGEQVIEAAFDASLDEAQYAFVCLLSNEAVEVRCSKQRLTGVLAVTNRFDAKVATGNVQEPPEGSGIDTFAFWRPLRRPGGHNLAVEIDPPLDVFGAENVTSGVDRPVTRPNAWVADVHDPAPALTLRWDTPQRIGRLELVFDTDLDHPMESVLMGHPERAMPFCVRRYRVCTGAGEDVIAVEDNHQTRNVHRFSPPLETDRLVVRLEATHSADVPLALFAARAYADG